MTESGRLRWSNTTFLVGFGIALVLFYQVLSAYVVTLVLAAVVAIVLHPIHERLAGILGGRRTLAAWVVTVITVLFFLAPTALILIRVIQEAIPFVSDLAQTLGEGGIAHWLEYESPRPVRAVYERVLEANLGEQARSALQTFATWLAGFAAGLPTFVALLVTDGIILIVTLVWFFAAGPAMAARLIESIPMEPRYTRDLFRTMGAGVRTIILTSALTALVQAAMGFPAFYFLSLPYPLLLAGMMAFFSFIFSLIPVLGSGLVWGPAGVALIISGRVWAGIFLLAYGMFVLGSVDNVLKPFLARGTLRLPPALIFVTLFGGISAFGPVGALLGPLLAAVVGAFLRIWREDFLRLQPMTEGGPHVHPPTLPPTPHTPPDEKHGGAKKPPPD